MSLLSKSQVGRIIQVTGGVLKGKYAMIVKEFDEGVGVITDPSDWPIVPLKFNAIWVANDRISEVTEEVETMLRIKFPDAKQFK